MTRALLLCLVACFACVACKEAPVSPPAAASETELTQIRALRAQTGDTGTQVGELWEREGDVLAKQEKWREAAAAYDHARVAYGQTPEATNMPVIRAENAKKKADAARAH